MKSFRDSQERLWVACNECDKTVCPYQLKTNKAYCRYGILKEGAREVGEIQG